MLIRISVKFIHDLTQQHFVWVLVAGWLLVASGCRDSETPVRATPAELSTSPPTAAWQVLDSPDDDPVTQVWPSLFGPAGNSHVPGRRPVAWLGQAADHVAWRAELGTGYASPVIARNFVVVLHRRDDREYLQALRLDDGMPVWEQSWPTTFSCPYDYSNGPASTPLIALDRVFAVGAQGHVHCVDLQTGEVRWQRELLADSDRQAGPFGVGASPQLIGGHVIFHVGVEHPEGSLVALNPDNGEPVWRSVSQPASCSTPVRWSHAGKEDVICLTDVGLVVVDGLTGQELSTLAYRSKIPLQVNATTPVWVGQELRVSAYGMGTAAIEIGATGQLRQRWQQRRSLDSQYNNLLVTTCGLVGFSARSHRLTCIDSQSGEMLWELDSPVGRGNQLLLGDHVLVLGESGQLALIQLSAASPTVIGWTPEPLLSGRCYSMPAFARDRLVLKSDGELVCLGRTQPDPR